MWLWLRLVVLRGFGSSRLAADSPLLLLDMDVVHSIASALSQPCCITLAEVHDAAATTMAALPTIPEIVWPENTILDDDRNFSLLDDDLNFSLEPGLGLDVLDLDDDDIEL